MALVKELTLLSKWYDEGKLSKAELDQELDELRTSSIMNSNNIKKINQRFPRPHKVVFDVEFFEGSREVISFDL